MAYSTTSKIPQWKRVTSEATGLAHLNLARPCGHRHQMLPDLFGLGYTATTILRSRFRGKVLWSTSGTSHTKAPFDVPRVSSWPDDPATFPTVQCLFRSRPTLLVPALIICNDPNNLDLACRVDCIRVVVGNFWIVIDLCLSMVVLNE